MFTVDVWGFLEARHLATTRTNLEVQITLVNAHPWQSLPRIEVCMVSSSSVLVTVIPLSLLLLKLYFFPVAFRSEHNVISRKVCKVGNERSL